MENKPIQARKTSIPEHTLTHDQQVRLKWANEQLAKTYDQIRAWYDDLGKKRGKWWQKSFRQVMASDHVREVEFRIEKEIHAVVNGQNEAVQREAGKRVLEGCAYLGRYVRGKMKIE